MRGRLMAAAMLAAGSLAVAVPALAQDDAGSVFGRLVDALLGEPEKAEEEQTPAAQPDLYAPTLEDVLAHRRRDEDRARDLYRHPAETLRFFQVQPGMTVVDYLPAGGWYTRIIAPYLGPRGHYIAMGPDVRGMGDYFQRAIADLDEKFPAQAAGWNLGEGPRLSAFNTHEYPEALDGTVDRVLIFREMHNQFRFGWLNADMLAIRKMLKPGGMVGITDHRMYESAPFSMTDGNKGYMRQSDVIELMDAYGFDLVGTSEVNANPKDTKDYERGVWELPPSLAGATDRTRAQKLAIGESDRMTLLFRMRP